MLFSVVDCLANESLEDSLTVFGVFIIDTLLASELSFRSDFELGLSVRFFADLDEVRLLASTLLRVRGFSNLLSDLDFVEVDILNF